MKINDLVNSNGLILQCCVCHNIIKEDRSVIQLSENEKEFLKQKTKEDYTILVSHGYCKKCSKQVFKKLEEMYG